MEKFSFWTIFAVVFLAEIPCILRTLALQIRSDGIGGVIWGTLAGSVAALVVGIFLAKVLSLSIPPNYISWLETLSGIGLIAIGIMLIFHHH